MGHARVPNVVTLCLASVRSYDYARGKRRCFGLRNWRAVDFAVRDERTGMSRIIWRERKLRHDRVSESFRNHHENVDPLHFCCSRFMCNCTAIYGPGGGFQSGRDLCVGVDSVWLVFGLDAIKKWPHRS